MKTNQRVEQEPETTRRGVTRRFFLTALGAEGLALVLPRSAFSQAAEPEASPLAPSEQTAENPVITEASTSPESEKPWQLFAEAHPGKIENWDSTNPSKVRAKMDFPITGVPAASIALELDVWADNTRRGAAQNIQIPGAVFFFRENSGFEVAYDKNTDGWFVIWGKSGNPPMRRAASTELKGTDLRTRIEVTDGKTLTYTMPDGSNRVIDLQGINLNEDTTPARCGWGVNPHSTVDFKTIKVFTRELPPATAPAAPETPLP